MDGREAGPRPVRPVWTAGQVARELRIAEATLRSWHRRYGVAPRPPAPGQYRRYSEEDVARLRRMRDLISQGVLPSEAARTVAVTHAAAPEEVLPEVLAAARQLDSPRCRTLLRAALDQLGVVRFWDDVCRPALRVVDADQRVDPDCVDSEHTLSWAVAATLHQVEAGRGAPAVLLACADGEQHSLPLEALAAALAERGTPVRMLGAAVPGPTLVRAAATVRPGAVVLWAQREEAARAETVLALRDLPLCPIVAGPGWPPPVTGVQRVTSLAAAVALLSQLVGTG